MKDNIDDDENGVKVDFENNDKNGYRWPAFEKSIEEAANKGKTCFFEFKEKQKKDENGRPYYYPEYNGLREVMDEGKQNYKDFKAFIKKHESDFKKLVRKHDLMLVYLDRRVFLVPTRYLKNKEGENIIKKMITPIVNYHKQCYKKMKKNYYIHTHGTGTYDPFICGSGEADGSNSLEIFPIREMFCILTNNSNGLVASTYGMQQRGKRQGKVLNMLFNEIKGELINNSSEDSSESKSSYGKARLNILGSSFGNVVNNVILDELLHKDDSVLKKNDGNKSFFNVYYSMRAPYFNLPFTPSYEYNYSSLVKNKLPNNFTIHVKPSRYCINPIHPRCITNKYINIFSKDDNTKKNILVNLP